MVPCGHASKARLCAIDFQGTLCIVANVYSKVLEFHVHPYRVLKVFTLVFDLDSVRGPRSHGLKCRFEKWNARSERGHSDDMERLGVFIPPARPNVRTAVKGDSVCVCV